MPTKTSGKSYQICGVINQIDDTTLEITELPIRKWTQVGAVLVSYRPAAGKLRGRARGRAGVRRWQDEAAVPC